MTRFLLSIVLGVSAALGLLLPLALGEATVIVKTLAQTPVTGRLADGGTFRGRLTLRALRFDEAGQLVATGVLAGMAPLTVAPLVQELTLVPVVLAPETAPKKERRLQMALCTVARLQEEP
jgi:hypothetical protein